MYPWDPFVSSDNYAPGGPTGRTDSAIHAQNRSTHPLMSTQ
ncbi:hypothetical protein EBESD8_23380 [Rhodococcus aetherivorans]|nr:hypothetical protein EBESD8_23380 [Rhodococcus aetherivorans]